MAAISKIQQVTGTSADAGTISLTLNGVQAGNSLVLAVAFTNNTAGGPALTSANIAGMTATLGAEATTAAASGGYGVRPRIFYQHNVSAGNKTVVITLAGEDWSSATLMEIQGLANAAPDMTKYAAGTTTSGNPVISTGTSAATTQTNSLIFAYAAHTSENSSTTYTQPAGWTRVSTQPDGFNSTSTVLEMKIAPSITTHIADWTSNRNAQWTAFLVSFKGADAAPTTGNPIKPLFVTNGEVTAAQLYDVVAVENGGTGLFSYTAGSYLRALSSTVLEQRTTAQVLADIGALAATSYTAADVLTKLLTVDGTTSGLDADLLDGLHASAFALVGHTHTSFTGDLTLSGDLLPDVDNVRSLGSPTMMWRDVYIGPGSLYLNGQKILEDTESGTIRMTADPHQNIAIQTSGTGDVELQPLGSGLIQLKGSVVFSAGTLIRSSTGAALIFDDPISFSAGTGITGGLSVTGGLTVDGNTVLTNSNYTAADVLTKLLTVDGAGSNLDADLLDGVQGANYTRADLTNLGKTGSTGIDTTTNTAALWSALPIGYTRFMSSTIGTAGGLPIAQHGYFSKIGNRDTAGGWAGLYVTYTGNNDVYVGVTADSSTLPTWRKIWTDATDGASSGLDADLLDGQQGTYFLDLANATGTLAANKGGTGLASYTTGNYINAASATTLQQRTPAQVLTDIGGLAASAYTAADVRTKLLTVDGAGSGIDADLLDGLNSTDFAFRNGSNIYQIGGTGVGTANIWYEVFKWTVTSQYNGFNAKFDLTRRGNIDSRVSIYVRGEYSVAEWNDYATSMVISGEQMNSEDKFMLVMNDAAKTVSLYYARNSEWNNAYVTAAYNQLNNATFAYVNTSTAVTTDPTGDYTVFFNSSTFTKFMTTANDGAGSLFDADLLDGQQGSYYLDAANHTGTSLAANSAPTGGTHTMTLAGGQRLRYTGSAGYSWIQAGDPATDDSGGKLRISGYLATLADEVRIDTALLISTGSLNINGTTTEDKAINVGQGRTGDGNSYLDLIGDATYTDYGTRLIRGGTANGTTQLLHRGTGAMYLTTSDAAPLIIRTGATDRMNIGATGNIGIYGVVNIAAVPSNYNGDVFSITPTDTGVGKPKFLIKKNTVVDAWTIGLWDGVNNAGSIDISANTFTKQGSTIWHAGNDGAASGLDADLLDGQQGSYYLDAANLTGSIADARLSSNVPLKNTGNTFTAGNTFSGSVILDLGGGALALKAGATSDHVYMQFYARSATQSTRTGYLGYGAAASNVLRLNNEITNGPIDFVTNGTGTVTVNNNVIWHAGNLTPSNYGLLAGGTDYTGSLATTSTGGLIARNPNNTAANVAVSWLNDAPRIRVGGSGTGAGGTFSIQGTSDFIRMSVDASGNGVFAGTLTIAGNTAWHAGNDGVGSGLDSDLLDGQQGSYYLDLANTTGTLTAAKGGTGLSSYTAGNYVRAATSATLEQRTPAQVRADIGAITFTSSETAPSNPNQGDEWVIPSTGKKYKWYNDGTSSQWIELDSVTVSGPAVQTYIQDTQPGDTNPYFWIQSGVGADGTGFTLWINDGN